MNNVIYSCNRELSMSIENVAKPLDADRQIERLLCSTVREASNVLSQCATKALVLTQALTRRDNMVRAGRDPDHFPNLFSLPISSTSAIPDDTLPERIQQELDTLGTEAQSRQDNAKRRWKLIQEQRRDWYKKHGRKEPATSDVVEDLDVKGD
jgi:hypothetical protein